MKRSPGTIPRFVVLGEPGGGRARAGAVPGPAQARGALRLAQRRLLPVRIALQGWERAVAWDPAAADLAAYLAGLPNLPKPTPTAEQWRTWLLRGDVLLLLDGLDEVAGDKAFQSAVKRLLSDHPRCPAVLTCRTVSHEQPGEYCPDFPVFLLSGLEDAQRDRCIRRYPAEYPARFDREGLIAALQDHPAMQPLAANPLLMWLLCFVVEHDGMRCRPPAASCTTGP